MDSLGQLFNNGIQQVSYVEKQRQKQEPLALLEPMLQTEQQLRERLGKSQRLLAAVSEEMHQAKWKLFASAGRCTQSQVTLAVAQSAITPVGLFPYLKNSLLWQADLAALALGPAEGKADGRGGFDEVQGAGGGPEGQSWAPETGLSQTSIREHQRTQASDSSMTY